MKTTTTLLFLSPTIASPFSPLSPRNDTDPATCITATLEGPLHATLKYWAPITGTFNMTWGILPISLATARSLIPVDIPILEEAYREVLPGFPEGQYPVFVQAGVTSQIKFAAFDAGSFTRIGLEFPFLDLLKDGHTSFRYQSFQVFSASNPLCLTGSSVYGMTPHPSTFDPPCDTYAFVSDSDSSTTYLNGTSTDSVSFASVTAQALPASKTPKYALSSLKNITNQPSFSDNWAVSGCLVQQKGLNFPEAGPRMVTGQVRTNLGPFVKEVEGEFDGVQIWAPFLEWNFVPCWGLAGYEDTSDELIEATK